MLMTINLGHSTNTCDVLTGIISYYRQPDSSICICFIDFTKTLENVDYWLASCLSIINLICVMLQGF